MPSYPVDELPPNHKALVELLISLKVRTVLVGTDIVLISYSNRNEQLEVPYVPSNSSQSD